MTQVLPWLVSFDFLLAGLSEPWSDVGGTGLGVATTRGEPFPAGDTESRRWKETRAEKREPLVVAVALPEDELRTL